MPGEFYIEGKAEKVDISDILAEITELAAKLDDTVYGLAAIASEVTDNETKIDNLQGDVSDIKSHADKLSGELPESDSVTANWNSGLASSGNAGADLVSVGASDTRYKLHSLLVNIANMTPGSVITVRMYTQVNGAEQEVYNQSFTRGTDPNGLWIVNGTVGIHEVLRVEVYSNQASDDGIAVDYDYMLEAI